MPETIARRVRQHEAKRHFDAGGSVLISEYGHELTCSVYPDSTTHNNKMTTWAELAEVVTMWRNRYPDQRFYIIPTPQAEKSAND